MNPRLDSERKLICGIVMSEYRPAIVAMLALVSTIGAFEIKGENGGPASSCSRDTGGSCRLLSCSSSRGLTTCKDGKCLCVGDYCAHDGACVPSHDVCPQATAGLCPVGTCDPQFGQTKCVDSKCVCADGACSLGGVCSSECERTRVSKTCANLGPHGGCPGEWGAVGCFDGQCECKAGNCMVQTAVKEQYHRGGAFHTVMTNKCQPRCEKITGGSCNVGPCHASRGPTDCIEKGLEKICICKTGYCLINDVCVPSAPKPAEAVATALAAEDISSTTYFASSTAVVVAAVAMGAIAMVALYRRSVSAARMSVVQEPLL